MLQPLFSASGVAGWRVPVGEKKAAFARVLHFSCLWKMCVSMVFFWFLLILMFFKIYLDFI